MPEKKWGLAVRALIVDKCGQCLLMRRANCKTNLGKWELPGGKSDEAESFAQALLREVREETGLNITIQRTLGAVQVELPKVRAVQLIMLARPESGRVRLSDEHDAFAWVPRGQIAKMDVIAEFRPFFRQIRRLLKLR